VADPFRSTEAFTSWGRVVRALHRVARPSFRDEVPGLSSQLHAAEPGLATGLLRSYGDSNLNPGGRILDMTGLDRMIAFDRTTGRVRAEAGMSLSQCLRVLVPAGWFLPTTPGSRFVTLGGAVANDVHGKNHDRAGSFGNSVTRIGLRRTDGDLQELAQGEPLFHATIGGMGLTGVIEWVEFEATPIRSAWFDAEDTPFGNLGEYFELSRSRKRHFDFTMAWIDCLATGEQIGRGIFTAGAWSGAGGLTPHRELPGRSMPVEAPGFLLNSLSIRAFNETRFRTKSMRTTPYRTHYEPFLYPLDSIANWNRMYGERGFYQYQCVLPPHTAANGCEDLLRAISRSGQGSFLAVLKDLGPRTAVGLMSFPMEGTTLALDFPNRGERTLALMRDLDAIVKAAGGRLYPAKDGRMPADMFRAGYPQWEQFRNLVDPGLSSAFWKRVSA
jgi:FAD/FMN-containing dehydrogenase